MKGGYAMNVDLTPEEDLLVKHRFGEASFYMRPEIQAEYPHFHYQYELLLCATGTASFQIQDRRYNMVPGSILFISNLENHFIFSHDSAFNRYSFRFSTRAAEMMRNPILLSIFRQRPEGFNHLIQCNPKELTGYLDILQEIEKEYIQREPCWSQIVDAYFLTLLSRLYRHHPESFPATRHPEGQLLIFQIQSYIESHLDADLSLDTLADRFYVNKFHLSHQFTRFTGYNFKQFITAARLSKAKDLLLNGDAEVQQVAEQVGYHSAAHFIRVFKEAEGLSPLQYRLHQRQI